jgi:hypothetical protein
MTSNAAGLPGAFVAERSRMAAIIPALAARLWEGPEVPADEIPSSERGSSVTASRCSGTLMAPGGGTLPSRHVSAPGTRPVKPQRPPEEHRGRSEQEQRPTFAAPRSPSAGDGAAARRLRLPGNSADPASIAMRAVRPHHPAEPERVGPHQLRKRGRQ